MVNPLFRSVRSGPLAAVAAAGLLLAASPGAARAADPPASAADAKPAAKADAVAPAPLPHLDLHSSPYRPISGETANLRVRVKPADGGKAADLPEETTVRLYIVRDDVGELDIVETKRGDGGEYEAPFAFPSGGDWRVFANVVPDEGTPYLTDGAKLSVDGARPVREPLIAQVMPMARVSGYTLALRQPTKVLAGTPQQLVFILNDMHGNPVTDTDLWQGAIAHLLFVDRDAKTLLHLIPDPDDPRNGRTQYLTFTVNFPKDGVWRGWLAFNRAAQQVTIPFALRVSGR